MKPHLVWASAWKGSRMSWNRLKPIRPALRRLAVGMPVVAWAALRCRQKHTNGWRLKDDIHEI